MTSATPDAMIASSVADLTTIWPLVQDLPL